MTAPEPPRRRYRTRVRSDERGNCGICHGPIESWRGPGAACCEACAWNRKRAWRAEGRAALLGHSRVEVTVVDCAALMRQAETPLPGDDYAMTARVPTDSEVETLRLRLRAMLHGCRQLRGAVTGASSARMTAAYSGRAEDRAAVGMGRGK